MAVRTVNIGRPANRTTNPQFAPRIRLSFSGFIGRELPGLSASGGATITLWIATFRASAIELAFSTNLVANFDLTNNVPNDMGMAFRNADSTKWIGFSVDTANTAAANNDVTDNYRWTGISGTLLTDLTAFRRNMQDEDFFLDYDTEGLIARPSTETDTGKSIHIAGREHKKLYSNGVEHKKLYAHGVELFTGV